MRERETLITGSEMFTDYIIQRIQEVFEANRFGENDSLFMGMRVKKRRAMFPDA